MENLNFNLVGVINIRDGVAQIDGLSGCMSGELVLFFICYTFFIFNSKKIKNLFLALPIVSTECSNNRTWAEFFAVVGNQLFSIIGSNKIITIVGTVAIGSVILAPKLLNFFYNNNQLEIIEPIAEHVDPAQIAMDLTAKECLESTQRILDWSSQISFQENIFLGDAMMIQKGSEYARLAHNSGLAGEQLSDQCLCRWHLDETMFTIYGLESDAFFRLDSMKINFEKVQNLLHNIRVEKDYLIKSYEEFLALSGGSETEQTKKVAAAFKDAIASVNSSEKAVENIQFFFEHAFTLVDCITFWAQAAAEVLAKFIW